MRRVAVACLIAACGGVVVAPAESPPVVPRVPRADFVVVPAELGDFGVLDRIPHRVRLRTIGDSWLREDGKLTRRNAEMTANVVLPAIGETPDKVRVAFGDDKTRLAIWIRKSDTWPILAAPTTLADADGKVARDAGVFVRQGAALHVDPPVAPGPQRHVRLDDPDIAVAGFVPASLIATVWIAGEGEPPPTLSTSADAEWAPAKPQPYTELVKGATVRTAAAPGAPAIAVTRSEGVAARLAGTRAGYAQVEIARRYARIVGFVLESELSKTLVLLGVKTRGRGHGFGMSHVEQIEVPAGTCLFDELEGQVIGVTIKTMTQLGSTRQSKPNWALVHIGTQWGTRRLYIKNLGDDPKQPKWESCTQPAVRK